LKYKEFVLVEKRAKKLLDTLIAHRVEVEKIDEYNIRVKGNITDYVVSIAKPNRVEVKEEDTEKYVCIVDNHSGSKLNVYDRAITRILSLINDEKMKKHISTL